MKFDMFKCALVWIFFLWILNPLISQQFRAFVDEDYQVHIDTITGLDIHFRTESRPSPQMQGFPLRLVANTVHKNFRNVALADINGTKGDEILFGANDQFFVYSKDEILWTKKLSGIAIYPPSVADLDGDGDFEIIQTTGGNNQPGRLYAWDHRGEPLPGWPLNFDDHWMLSAAAVSDVDNDGFMEIVVSERVPPAGKVHILKLNGEEWSKAWPVTLDKTPAVTPTIGDVDGDGDKDVIVYSTGTRYAFDLDSRPLEGWQKTTEPDQRYSYQSPILVEGNNQVPTMVLGASHGDAPQFLGLGSSGQNLPGWPIAVPELKWTFSTPSVVRINDQYKIFLSRPIGQNETEDVVYGWDQHGNLLPNFPLVKKGGLEGIICIANIDDDSPQELIFGSNLVDQNLQGTLHGYDVETGQEEDGFPLYTRGWTYMNGACLGDVDGDDLLDIVALSYTQNFGANTDSLYLNVFELKKAFTKDDISWGTYKGDNTRAGNFDRRLVSQSFSTNMPEISFDIFPNPTSGNINILFHSSYVSTLQLSVHDILGRLVYRWNISILQSGYYAESLDLSRLTPGFYQIVLKSDFESGCKKISIVGKN